MTNPFEAWSAAIDAAAPHYDRAIRLGWVVSASVHTDDVDREPARASFWVRRFDQSSGAERTFDSLDDVSRHLDEVEHLP